MAQLESELSSASSQQQQGHPSLPQQSPGSVQPPLEGEGKKEATVHDFMSLSGSRSSSSVVTVAKTGGHSCITTQDLLQPLQKAVTVLPPGFVLGSSKSHLGGGGEYSTAQQMAYMCANGAPDLAANLQSSQRPSDFSFSTRAYFAHSVPINKDWQQHQHQVVSEMVDGNKRLEILEGSKRPARGQSEDDDEDDDEFNDHGFLSRKDIRYQKVENAVQQLEGKTLDMKGLTPRSKHSATEQRRRSKINDRFQMLRQLLPNSDQKRDKASFLLEVIEYIQMLQERVKRYEAAEHLDHHQERARPTPWDRSSRHTNEEINAPLVQPLSARSYDVKEAMDANGYMRYQSSPLKAAITSSDFMSSKGHVPLSLPNTLPHMQQKHESTSLVSKPTPVTFRLTSGSELATTPLPEARAMFGQLLCEDDASCALNFKGEAITFPQLQQVSKPQISSYGLDKGSEESRSHEQSLNQRNPREGIEGSSSSSLKDLIVDGGLNSKLSQKDEATRMHELDVRQHGAIKRLREDLEGVHEKPAVLGGVINVSSPYSQGLLDTLTRALQSSGVDLGQASISVQIDLGRSSALALPNSQEMATLGTALPPAHNIESGLEHPNKIPKVEDDS